MLITWSSKVWRRCADESLCRRIDDTAITSEAVRRPGVHHWSSVDLSTLGRVAFDRTHGWKDDRPSWNWKAEASAGLMRWIWPASVNRSSGQGLLYCADHNQMLTCDAYSTMSLRTSALDSLGKSTGKSTQQSSSRSAHTVVL